MLLEGGFRSAVFEGRKVKMEKFDLKEVCCVDGNMNVCKLVST
jgi:hypothetical protein